MTTNETISKWLGFTEVKGSAYKCYSYNGQNVYENTLDFLHDRNQQKWIEDELIEKGYKIDYDYYYKSWHIGIQKDKYKIWFESENESKDTAFIECVLELIKKEETK
jgi:hypothetical protein